MCEDEGTRGGDETAEAARCGNSGKGTGELCQWFYRHLSYSNVSHHLPSSAMICATNCFAILLSIPL